MTPQRWSQIKEVFFAAREKSEPARSAYLDAACGHDPELRREVELLLSKDNEPSLRRPAEDFLGSILSELAAGQVLAQYRVEAKLGEGGMGAVYRAYDTRLRREVALKVLPPDRLADPESRQRLLREARAASALNHPNIVTVHEIGSAGGVDFITLELIQGKSLKKLIPAEGLPLDKTMDYAVQIAAGLAKAHAAGIIHRDLKPGNIMVTPDGMVKLLDFSLAHRVARTESETASIAVENDIAGTPAYMSPEQARGEELDGRTDLFSFGCVLYEMVTGRAAFSGATSVLVVDAILHQVPAAPLQLNPQCPPELERILNKALEKDRDLRYQSAGDLRSDLMRLKRDLESQLASGMRPANGRWEAASPGALRESHRRTAIAVAGITFLLIAAGTIGYRRLHKPAEPPMRVVPFTTSPGCRYGPGFHRTGIELRLCGTAKRRTTGISMSSCLAWRNRCGSPPTRTPMLPRYGLRTGVTSPFNESPEMKVASSQSLLSAVRSASCAQSRRVLARSLASLTGLQTGVTSLMRTAGRIVGTRASPCSRSMTPRINGP